ncbi:DUF685 domain-containing protein, partial [Borreliella valaisiana]
MHKNTNDVPIYLDIELNIRHNDDSSNKILYLKYSDEAGKNMVYSHSKAVEGTRIRVPMYKGWYIQKRIGSA